MNKKQLEQKKKEIQAEIYRLEEIEWKKSKSHLYDKAVGKCYGVNNLKSKNSQQYLTYFKHIARTDDREFDVITIEIRHYDGRVMFEEINRTTKSYCHADQIGDIYSEISEEEFYRVYEQVKKRILI